MNQDPSHSLRVCPEFIEGISFERKDMPAATYVNDQFIVGGEMGFRSRGQPKDRP
jgi:hypothetical protein